MRTTGGSEYAYGDINQNSSSVPSLWNVKDNSVSNEIKERTREFNNFQVNLNTTAYNTRPREAPKSQMGLRHLSCYKHVDFRDEGIDPYNKLANTFYGSKN